jgi:3-(3-hydroxy-phenyl)propionate hydroxylase
VLLAGDAAHQTPPFLGQGLNTGLRDAVNLGWKIPLVLAGTCDASLLETYAAERDAHARDLVEWAVAIGQLMETFAAREAGLPDPYEADESSGYGQGRLAPPLRGGVLVAEQCGGEHPVGELFRQPTVRAPGSEPCRLDELYGGSFAVVGRKQSDLQMSDAARGVLERVGGRAVALEGLEIVEGESDRLFDAHPAVVLRPDRYVFGVVDDDHGLDELLLRLGEKLALR